MNVRNSATNIEERASAPGPLRFILPIPESVARESPLEAQTGRLDFDAPGFGRIVGNYWSKHWLRWSVLVAAGVQFAGDTHQILRCAQDDKSWWMANTTMNPAHGGRSKTIIS